MHILKLGVLAAVMLVFLGCDGGAAKAQKTADEASKNLAADPEYAKKMQGQMGGAKK